MKTALEDGPAPTLENEVDDDTTWLLLLLSGDSERDPKLGLNDVGFLGDDVSEEDAAMPRGG